MFSRTTGRRLLGAIWLLDGILELFPDTEHSFIDLIRSQADGQPTALHDLLIWGANLLAPHAFLWNSALGVAEIILGVLLLVNILPRVTLLVAIALAALIWIWGQALGGMLTGSATDPGAMPLYILAALMVWPEPVRSRSGGAEQDPAEQHATASSWREGRGERREFGIGSSREPSKS
jgi:hypothetical protein